MFYVYILRSVKNGRLYTGFTNDLKRRFKEHSSGWSTYTKSRGPYTLIYYEAGLNEQDAVAREKYLKSGFGKRYIKSRLQRFFINGMNPVGKT